MIFVMKTILITDFNDFGDKNDFDL